MCIKSIDSRNDAIRSKAANHVSALVSGLVIFGLRQNDVTSPMGCVIMCKRY